MAEQAEVEEVCAGAVIAALTMKVSKRQYFKIFPGVS
jgi:hypothetical protein